MTWSSILGHEQPIALLRAHLRAGRTAPAYLFVGPEGIGKRLAARQLAATLLCEDQGEEACGTCAQCQRIARDVHPDLHERGPQGPTAVIRIEDAQDVLRRVALRPFMGRVQIVILDGADRLTDEAANSLLKAIEEPTRWTRFLLIATQRERCLPTIVSRCCVVRFSALSRPVLERWLHDEQGVIPRVAASASRVAEGSFAQAAAYARDWSEYGKSFAHCASGDLARWAAWPMPDDRKELARWLDLSVQWLRDVAVASVGADRLIRHQEWRAAILEHAHQFGADRSIDAGFRQAALWDALHAAGNARLIATLFRESWLDLLSPRAASPPSR